MGMRFEGAPSVRESILYETLPDGLVGCGVCERRCRIPDGRRGFCGSRQNLGGRLYTLTYGDLSSISLNPIEKKPLFHYWPGLRALSAGSWGCNLRCVYCQNHALSMADADPARARYLSPRDFVYLALNRGSQGISFTFNEASSTLMEYMIDCFPLARSEGLYCNLNTNAYITSGALGALIEAGLDSLCIDVKGDENFYRSFCNGADVEVVWRNAEEARRRGLHVEMVNLLIPGGNDGESSIDEIIARTRGIGRDTPLHFTRFYPAYRSREYGLTEVTPVESLERARSKALDEGLEYVYLGNVIGHEGENTFCPDCGRLLVRRYGFGVLEYNITDDDRCSQCDRKIFIVGKPISTSHR